MSKITESAIEKIATELLEKTHYAKADGVGGGE